MSESNLPIVSISNEPVAVTQVAPVTSELPVETPPVAPVAPVETPPVAPVAPVETPPVLAPQPAPPQPSDQTPPPVETPPVAPELPTISLSVTPNNVVEGVNTTLTFTLSQPVPVGGLALNLTTTDTDLALGDIAYNLTNSSNIAAVQDLSVAGANSGTLLVTLAEGATVATLVVDSIIDDIAENVETISYTLNPPTGYSVIPASNTGSVSITNSPTVFGTSASEVITATDGASFTIFGNGGNDTLTGAAGNDLIYGGSEADIILGGAGNDTIFGNGGYDYINSGSGIDVLGLDLGNALVVLEAGEGYDVINNFQLGANKLMVSSLNNLSFTDIIVGDTTTGVNVIQGDDLLAVVAGQNASTFSSNLAGIFVV